MRSACPNCGGDMVGDGFRDVRHCERVDTIGSGLEPDSGPWYCDGTDDGGWTKQVLPEPRKTFASAEGS